MTVAVAEDGLESTEYLQFVSTVSASRTPIRRDHLEARSSEPATTGKSRRAVIVSVVQE